MLAVPQTVFFFPGDSFAVLCPNRDEEVADLLKLLNAEDVAGVSQPRILFIRSHPFVGSCSKTNP